MRMGTALIILGIVLVAAGIIVNFTGSRRDDVTPENKISSSTPSVSESVFQEETHRDFAANSQVAVENNAPDDATQSSTDSPDYKEMGNDFEGYVADILKANGIRIKQWNQGSTSPEGAYGENELNPDFYVSHKNGTSSLEYWVECKYRSKIPASGFALEEYQLKRYYSIQGKSQRKIVIALGVGGNPKSPAEFYIIPVDTLNRFKRVGLKFLPNYNLKNPRAEFKSHLSDWFTNEVFKKKSSK